MTRKRRKNNSFFSQASINYIKGILTSDLATVGYMYSYGSGVTTAIKVFFIMLGSWTGMVAGNPSALHSFLSQYFKTLIPTSIENPIIGIFSFVFNVIFAAIIWGTKYEVSTRG